MDLLLKNSRYIHKPTLDSYNKASKKLVEEFKLRNTVGL